MNTETASAYLAGIIDGEGSVGLYRWSNGHGGKGYGRQVRIVNTDWDLLDACAEACEVLGIEFTVYARARNGRNPKHKDTFDFRIKASRENFSRLLDLPIRTAKRERLIELVESYRKAA
jgi:hypothetical protein